jgi:hypothetical protein
MNFYTGWIIQNDNSRTSEISAMSASEQEQAQLVQSKRRMTFVIAAKQRQAQKTAAHLQEGL